MMASKPVPSTELMRRHLAAMRVVKQLDPEDRIALLSYVVHPTPQILEAQQNAENPLLLRPDTALP